jgi:hypothetical protein
MISESPEQTHEIATIRKQKSHNVPKYQNEGHFYLPGSIMLRQHTLKYFPQAVPKSTLSDTILNTNFNEITQLDKT